MAHSSEVIEESLIKHHLQRCKQCPGGQQAQVRQLQIAITSLGLKELAKGGGVTST